MVSRAEFTLGQLAEALGATLEGDLARVVRVVAPLESHGPDDVSFLTDARYRAAAQASRAGAFVAGAGVTGLPAPILTVAAPQQAMIDLLLLFHPAPPLLPGVDASAVVAADGGVDATAAVGPLAVIEAGARIGSGARVGALTYVGPDVEVGEGCVLGPHVTLLAGARLGRRVLVHPGAVIGADGFGFAFDGARHRKIPQTGGVVIEDDVEVGANTTIDRATSARRRGPRWKRGGSSRRSRACPSCCSACARWSARWRPSAAVRSGARGRAMSDAIHPSAIIDPRARLEAGVRVGAFSVIGPEVTLESGVEIGHHAVLEGRVALGPRVKVGHGSVLGGVPQDLKYKDGTPSGVRVGADTVIREYVTVHRSTRAEGWTDIGRECLVMSLSHVAHDCRIGDGVIVINYAGLTGHCEIGDRATIGGLSGMVPFTRVGAYAYVGGMAKLTADVPPYVLVEGQPATARAINVIGLRRAGMNPADRRSLQNSFRILYRSGLAPARAIERIREEVPATEPSGAWPSPPASTSRSRATCSRPGSACSWRSR